MAVIGNADRWLVQYFAWNHDDYSFNRYQLPAVCGCRAPIACRRPDDLHVRT